MVVGLKVVVVVVVQEGFCPVAAYKFFISCTAALISGSEKSFTNCGDDDSFSSLSTPAKNNCNCSSTEDDLNFVFPGLAEEEEVI